jgi:hypothetical protein
MRTGAPRRLAAFPAEVMKISINVVANQDFMTIPSLVFPAAAVAVSFFRGG